MTTLTHRPVLLSAQELADYIGVPIRTLDRWRQRKEGPPFVTLGRHIRYPEDELLSWLRSRLSHDTAE